MGLETVEHVVDFCVVGGGLAGLCAAVAAARHGLRVLLMQERPVLGGNASSEIRVWVSGALGPNNRETGLLEEIMMDNQRLNPYKNHYVWDSILYGKAIAEKNLTLLLNCSCMDAEMDGNCIRRVRGWQMSTQRFHRVEARLFADCSGDSILAPLTGAPCRMGREAWDEYSESIAPVKGDRRTMGISCLIQAEETEDVSEFVPPSWAEKISSCQLQFRMPDLSSISENFWYLELGGDRHCISDAEEVRHDLQALAFGLWDYLKNDPAQAKKHERWRLAWAGALPGKRESRRYIGAYTLTEGDLLAGGDFSDEVAYGGWPMDDHDPEGFRACGPPNVFHPTPSPYGIPLRCLCTSAVPNLLFAGRNISATHAALSSTRVMGTCAALGQAAGTAAAQARDCGRLPVNFTPEDVRALQTKLMRDDCFLPHFRREPDPLCKDAVLSGDGKGLECLRDGTDRPRPDGDHAWIGKAGDRACYTFEKPALLRAVRLVFDSDLNRETLPAPERDLARNLWHNRPLSLVPSRVPDTMVRAYQVTAGLEDGREVLLIQEEENHHRLRIHPVCQAGCLSVTLRLLGTWGGGSARVFAFEAEGETDP